MEININIQTPQAEMAPGTEIRASHGNAGAVSAPQAAGREGHSQPDGASGQAVNAGEAPVHLFQAATLNDNGHAVSELVDAGEAPPPPEA